MSVLEVSDVQDYLGVKASDKVRTLSLILNGALTASENWSHRRFRPDPPLDPSGADTGTPVTKRFTTRGRKIIRIPDLRVATTISLGGMVMSQSYYDLGYNESDQTDVNQHPATFIDFAPAIYRYGVAWTAMPLDLVITGRWGWNPPPDDVNLAILTWIGTIYGKKDARFSDSVSTPDGAVLNYFSKGPPAEVRSYLSAYRVPNVGSVGLAI